MPIKPFSTRVPLIFRGGGYGGIFVLQHQLQLQLLGISPDFLVMPYLSTRVIFLAISFKDPRRLNAPA